MTSTLVQTLVLLAIVCSAAGYLVRRIWRAYRAATSTRCDNCGCGPS